MKTHGQRNGDGEKHHDGSSYPFKIVRSNVCHHCGHEVDDETHAGHDSHERPADSENEAERSG